MKGAWLSEWLQGEARHRDGLKCEELIKQLKFWGCLLMQLANPDESFHSEGSM